MASQGLGPLGSLSVPPPKDGTTTPSPLPNPPSTVRVPQNANRYHDLIMHFTRKLPSLAWAQTWKSGLETTAVELITVVSSEVENRLRPPLPLGSDERVKYKATVILQQKILAQDYPGLLGQDGKGIFAVVGGDAALDELGLHVMFQLVSTKIDPKTETGAVSEEVPILNWVFDPNIKVPTNLKFDLDFDVPSSFGTPGAIIVKNRHFQEFLLVSSSVTTPKEVINFPANSWVYSVKNMGEGRIFFSNEVYLPKDTPPGLKKLREHELQNLRGNGKGERKEQDRIYDYDVYNDLGNPDDPNISQKRPVLGGSKELPYPRRCRTGRPRTLKDPKSESRGTDLRFYVPRDERFNQVKFSDIGTTLLNTVQQNIIPLIIDYVLRDSKHDFNSLNDVKSLYVPPKSPVETGSNPFLQKASITSVMDQKTKTNPTKPDTSFYFPLPEIIAADDKAWSQDIEFGRQMVAGLNPLTIKLVKEFPIKSTLDPIKFGDPTSAITADDIKAGLEGLTVDQALNQKRLFVQDYHDIFLPYVERINALETSAIYAPRALVFLKGDNTLTPLAIELVLPPTPKFLGILGGSKKRSYVFKPSPKESKKNWVWELAKAHVASVDSAYHEVISHFLRTHACIEPFTIATNRQLSVLHPINQALVPHYRNTLDINALARKALINSGGIIEKDFTPGKYTMEMSAVVYKLDWRFDEQALPNDLVKRGMAEWDKSSPHGVKLVFEDYPYAADGLELWGALKDYMTNHVKLFYKSDEDVQKDTELRNWWTEVRTMGHGDKKDSPGWPKDDTIDSLVFTLPTIDSLVFTLTTIAWVASCHHAAVNFGQYSYAGYMPNRPSKTRKFIPERESLNWKLLQNDSKKAERFYLDSISNVDQATSVMSTIELLSTHAPDEEYLGQRLTPNWSNNREVLAAFEKFSKRTKEIEADIHKRNNNETLKNRSGPVKVKYELLLPTSEPGMTGRGVPNSVSI